MNKVVSTLILSVVSLWGVEFHSYEEALKLQKISKKTIMVDIVRTHCRYCEDMNKKVLQDPEFAKWLDAKFISARINLDNEKIPEGMRVDFTPTFYFVNHKHKIVKRVPGSWTIQDFKDLTEKIK